MRGARRGLAGVWPRLAAWAGPSHPPAHPPQTGFESEFSETWQKAQWRRLRPCPGRLTSWRVGLGEPRSQGRKWVKWPRVGAAVQLLSQDGPRRVR